tara:strand:+ start:18476 stop:19072 length:597 start_codon:yes stop_codon:yes gene_type:complete
MRYVALTLILSVIYSQDVQQVSEFKRDVAYGQDCDDTEYRNEWGTPNWKNYGSWLSECDSIRTVTLDREFAERAKIRQREKAIQDSIDTQEALAEIDNLDLDVMWENTVWEEIQDVGETIYGEVEQITAVAGVRGAEAEDEALHHLYYRRSMKGLALIDLQKAYGKLMIKRDNVTDPKTIEKIDNLLSQLEARINKQS